jgi:hypothetical protein
MDRQQPGTLNLRRFRLNLALRLKELDQLRIRNQLMINCMEVSGFYDPKTCFEYQDQLNARYKLLEDLLNRHYKSTLTS